MKRHFLLIVAAFSCILVSEACAQGEAPGVIKATTKLRPDGSRATTVVDPDARTAEETVYDAADKMQKKTKFILDERNFATEAIHYDAKGQVRYREAFRRDAMEHVVQSDFLTADGKPLGRRVYVYRGDKVDSIEDYDAKGMRITAAQPAKQGGGKRRR